MTSALTTYINNCPAPRERSQGYTLSPELEIFKMIQSDLACVGGGGREYEHTMLLKTNFIFPWVHEKTAIRAAGMFRFHAVCVSWIVWELFYLKWFWDKWSVTPNVDVLVFSIFSTSTSFFSFFSGRGLFSSSLHTRKVQITIHR